MLKVIRLIRIYDEQYIGKDFNPIIRKKLVFLLELF
jgi:hypothetical protein